MRTAPILARTLTTLLMALACSTAMGLELGLEGATGNLQLPWAPVAPITDSAFPDSYYYWGGQAWLAAPLGEDAAIRVSFERDPVLRNSAIAAVEFERGIASISVGPLFGLLNTVSAPFSIGLSASVRLQWPGVAYVSMRSDGGMAISLLQAASDPQARTELAAGIYVPHAIVSALVSAKRFNELDAGGNLVTDSLTRYAMTIDIFKKNVPYNALLSIGFEERAKRFAGPGTTDSLGAIVLGLDTTAQIDGAFKLKAGISTGAYVFGLDALQGRGPANSAFLFNANMGLSVDLAEIKPRPKPPKEEGEASAEASSESTSPAVGEAPAQAEGPAQVAATKSSLSVGVGGGLYYDAYPLSGTAFDILLALYNLRGGAWGDLMFPLKANWGLGGELGVFYMADSQIPLSLLDIPLNAKLSYQMGKLGFDALGGLYTTLSISSSTVLGLGMDAGLRVRFAGFYAEGGYILGFGALQSFPRFGLGYSFPIIK